MAIKRASEILIRPKIADIVNMMTPGDTVVFNAVEFGEIGTARGAVSRANARAGRREWEVVTSDRGVTYRVKRLTQEEMMRRGSGKGAGNGR